MKTALILFGDENVYFNEGYFNSVVNTLLDGGLKTDVIEILPCADDLRFKRRLEEFKDTMDTIVILEGENVSFNLREVVSEITDSPLIENENAKNFIQAVGAASGTNYPAYMALLPMDASVIPNLTGAYQGFFIEKDEATIAVMPADLKQFKSMCSAYLIPYAEKKFGVKRRRLTLKYFGDKERLLAAIGEAREISECKFNYNIYEKNGDCTVNLLFSDGEDKPSRAVVRHIVGELSDDIYAEFDTTLGERLFDVLKLNNLKIAVAESFTGGRVVSELIKCSGASNYVHEGIVSYSNTAKVERLGVNADDLKRNGAVSSTVAYQMAAGLLKQGNCDAAIATTGIAGPKSDDSNFPVGLCYIAVGTVAGIHTYKFNFSGTREEITETAKNTALFLAIKKLKRI